MVNASNMDGALTPGTFLNLRAALGYCGGVCTHHHELVQALVENMGLQQELDRRDADDRLLDLVIVGVPWLLTGVSMVGFQDATWPPTWLVEAVEQGRSDAIQADRAQVITKGLMVAAIPLPAGARWYRHGVAPASHDQEAYASARRVLARLRGHT